MPTLRRSHTVPSIEPTQPSRQSAVPAGFKLAAPERPPNAPPRVKPSDQERTGSGDVGLVWARSPRGALDATPSATMRFETKRRDIISSQGDVVERPW